MGFLGSWDETKNLDAYSGHINASARLPASLSIGDTRLVANALDLGSGGGWFWPLFGGGTRPHEICAGLVPADAGLPAGWMHAAPLLVLEQASVQARPGRVSERYTLHAHAHAFIAETVRAGGIAVTRLDAELMRPGIALTAPTGLIDEIADELRGATQAPPSRVARSVHLSGNW